MKSVACGLAFFTVFAAATSALLGAQASPARQTGQGTSSGSSSSSVRPPDATLLQVMRGILYPSSNVVFAAQEDITKLPKADNPATSPNLLTSTYGGWTAVENASLALAESARLITVPGRTCSNGKPVPVQRADWIKFSNRLRGAGLAAYKAAQSKNVDAMVEASGTVADACQACHEKYREKPAPADRCS